MLGGTAFARMPFRARHAANSLRLRSPVAQKQLPPAVLELGAIDLRTVGPLRLGRRVQPGSAMV